MSNHSIWIVGSTRSGKTNRLIQQLCTWAETNTVYLPSRPFSTFLVLSATGDNRIELTDRILATTEGRYRFDSATPLGFFQDEVTVFLPLIAPQLKLQAQFPLRLRPETEQELATQLWRSRLDDGKLRQAGVQDYYMVRRTLDVLQLAAASGTPHEELEAILNQGFTEQTGSPELWATMSDGLEQWWKWCLERGLFTYGIITELYWRYLLPHPTYQQHLKRRYHAVLADDVDEYPAVTYSLFEFFLDRAIPVALTYNPNGGIRLGLGADPAYLGGLAARCHHVENLSQEPDRSIGATWGSAVVEWLRDPMQLPQLPDSIQTIQTTSSAELLRQTAQVITEAVLSGEAQPQDIGIIAPGLSAIARYTLREILTSRGIPVRSLNDQRPLASSPLIRALLTLLALVYPGLGRLLSRETVAEMLVLLSQTPGADNQWDDDQDGEGGGEEGEEKAEEGKAEHFLNSKSKIQNPFWNAQQGYKSKIQRAARPAIDPVRAGLITDHCFSPDPEHPRLLPVSTFSRWDRLGYQAAHTYTAILDWIETQKQQQQQHLIPSPVVLLDRAIQRFLYGGSHLPYDQLAAVRELMETAQHYWEVNTRLRQHSRSDIASSIPVGQFIQLLRDGTITADPYPVRPIGRANQAVTLATVYQYRSDRRFHRWQFWLDAGSPFWLTGGSMLFGAPLFLREWAGRPWTVADTLAADQRRLERQVMDLLCRAEERVYLCYSELSTNGQEQAGPLLSLVNAALPVAIAPARSH